MKRVIGIVLALAFGAVVFVARTKQAEKVDATIEATQLKLADVFSRTKDYDKYSGYLDEAADAAHKHAFDTAYTPSGRRRSVRFDPRTYVAAFCDKLLSRAKLIKADDRGLGLFLRQLQIDVEAAAKAGEFD